jgi:nucleotide-binding universal stress UspA family protein
MKVIAAIDNSLAARPVIATAVGLSRLLGAEPMLLHVTDDGERIARGAADAAGLPLETLAGPVVTCLLERSREEDVIAVVVGARGTPGGRRPLGGTALALATALEKPVVAVPPHSPPNETLRRILVPVEGSLSTSLIPRAILRLCSGSELEVVVLHVLEEESLPSFTDQPQHEREAWAREFLRRYCPWGIGRLQFETRVGEAEALVPLVAEEADVDLIALGWAQELAEGRAPVVRATLGRGRTPVLLVPVTAGSRRPPSTKEEEESWSSLHSLPV